MNDMTRPTRNMEKREASERPKSWAPPSLLPDPQPEEGYKFRWIRVASLNQADPANISSKFREGWEPVKASTQPHMQMFVGGNPKFPDGIEIGGLVLCKCPSELMDQRDAYYSKQSASQMASVDNNFMRDNDARMPLFKERQTKVSFGTGT